MQKWHVGQKVSNTFSSVPIFKHQTFFLQELYQNERIQQIPVDLDILGHSVPSYCTPVLLYYKVIDYSALYYCITAHLYYCITG